MPAKTILFIHGLWLHKSSWDPWMDFFQQEGYTTLNPGWIGEADTVADCRTNPAAVANKTVRALANHYANIIEGLNEPPILIGHSFGGLLAQILLGENKAAAAIAINPAPMKGVWQLPLSTLKGALPVIGNPFHFSQALQIGYKDYRYAFANALSEDEANTIYDRWAIPSPARPMFQAAMATLIGSETKVNTSNSNRGPLLITGSTQDHIVPPILTKAAVKKYQSQAVTDYIEFQNMGHSLVADHNWKELANYSFTWLKKQEL